MHSDTWILKLYVHENGVFKLFEAKFADLFFDYNVFDVGQHQFVQHKS